MRFLAAAVVFWFHVALQLPTGMPWFERVTRAGPVGVSFFFILSGFVLAWSYRPREAATKFYRRRIARIVPNYIVTLLLSIPLLIFIGRSFSAGGGLATFFLVQSWVPAKDVYFAMNPVSWSLSCEAFFYVLFPLVMPRALGLAARDRRRLMLGIFGLIFAVPLVALALFQPATQQWFIYISPATRFLEFALGILLALEVRDGRWPKLRVAPVAGLTVAAYLVATFAPRPFRPIAITVVPFVLLIGALAQSDLARARSPLRTRAMVRLGEWSYSFYLIHIFVLWSGREVLNLRTTSGVELLVLAALLFAVTVAASAALYYVIERPMERRLRDAPTRPSAAVADKGARELLGKQEGLLPARVGGVGLIVGVLSIFWDIAVHHDQGRDQLFSPAHLGVIAGVGTAVLAVFLGILADKKRAGTDRDWSPTRFFTGVRPGLLLAGAGLLAWLWSGPLDNIWHNIYGVDTTIWSPPHMLGILGTCAAAMGLVMTVAPASRHGFSSIYYFLWAGLLVRLGIVTFGIEIGSMNYPNETYPILLTLFSTFVLSAAAQGPKDWGATRVALWFEGIRALSVLMLFGLGRSLPFVPLLIPTAVVVDVIYRKLEGRKAMVAAGLGAAAATVTVNWLLNTVLDQFELSGQDLTLGSLGAVAAGVLGATAGAGLGRLFVHGGPRRPRARFLRPGAVATGLAIIVLLASPAAAQTRRPTASPSVEARGSGTIEYQDEVEEDKEADVTISDLEVRSGEQVQNVRVQARMDGTQINFPVTRTDGSYSAEIELPSSGDWTLVIGVKAGDERLVATEMLQAVASNGKDPPEREGFVLQSLDAFGQRPPGALLYLLSYGALVVVAVLLAVAFVKALRRFRAQA